MKRYSTLLIIKEIQIKTPMRYHLTPIRMAIIKKTRNDKCWQGCGEKETLMHCCGNVNWYKPLWKMVWRFCRKLKLELPYDPAVPLLGIYPKTKKTLTWKYICTPMSITALFTIANIWKQPKCSLMYE